MICFGMMHYLIILAIIFITSTFILIKVFKGRKQSAWIIRKKLVCFSLNSRGGGKK